MSNNHPPAQEPWEKRMDRLEQSMSAFEQKQQADHERKLKEWAEWEEKQKAEHERAMKRMAEIEDQWGGFVNGEGKMLEDRAFAFVEETGEVAGIKLKRIYFNLGVSGDRKGQYDIVGVNDTQVVVMECKRTLRPDHVRRFVEDRLPLFAEAFPELAQGREIIGAIIYELAEKGAAELALESGLILLRAEGKRTLRQITPADLQKEKHKKGKR